MYAKTLYYPRMLLTGGMENTMLALKITGRRPDEKLTPAELAEFLGTNEAVLNTWRVKGRGPAYQKRADWFILYAVEDIEAWFNEQKPWCRVKRSARWNVLEDAA